MTINLLQISSHKGKEFEYLIRILFLLSLDPREMSLNIDIKIIRRVIFSDTTLNLDSNSWTSVQSSNVGMNSVDSSPILSNTMYSEELLKYFNLSSHTMFDFGLSFLFSRHNTESEKS